MPGEDLFQNITEDTDSEKVDFVALTASLPEAEKAELADKKTASLRDLIPNMKLPEKLKLAMLGPAEARALLIGDKLKVVSEFVLKNPKLTIEEIEGFTKNTNLSSDILRNIANNKEWTSRVSIQANLVKNPKTPIDISMKWVRYLPDNELKLLARSKNIPTSLAQLARKLAADKQRRK